MKKNYLKNIVYSASIIIACFLTEFSNAAIDQKLGDLRNGLGGPGGLKGQVGLLSENLAKVSTKLFELEKKLKNLGLRLVPGGEVIAEIDEEKSAIEEKLENKSQSLTEFKEEEKKQEQEIKAQASSAAKTKGGKTPAEEKMDSIRAEIEKEEKALEVAREQQNFLDDLMKSSELTKVIIRLKAKIKIKKIDDKDLKATLGKIEMLSKASIDSYATTYFNKIPFSLFPLLLPDGYKSLKTIYTFLISAHFNHENFKTALGITENQTLSDLRKLFKFIFTRRTETRILDPNKKKALAKAELEAAALKKVQKDIVSRSFFKVTREKQENNAFISKDFKLFLDDIMNLDEQSAEYGRFKFSLVESNEQKTLIIEAWNKWVDSLKTPQDFIAEYFNVKLNKLFDQGNKDNNQTVLNEVFTTFTDVKQDWYQVFSDKITEKKGFIPIEIVEASFKLLETVDEKILEKERYDAEQPDKIAKAAAELKAAEEDIAKYPGFGDVYKKKKALVETAKKTLEEAKASFKFKAFNEEELKLLINFSEKKDALEIIKKLRYNKVDKDKQSGVITKIIFFHKPALREILHAGSPMTVPTDKTENLKKIVTELQINIKSEIVSGLNTQLEFDEKKSEIKIDQKKSEEDAFKNKFKGLLKTVVNNSDSLGYQFKLYVLTEEKEAKDLTADEKISIIDAKPLDESKLPGIKVKFIADYKDCLSKLTLEKWQDLQDKLSSEDIAFNRLIQILITYAIEPQLSNLNPIIAQEKLLLKAKIAQANQKISAYNLKVPKLNEEIKNYNISQSQKWKHKLPKLELPTVPDPF